MKTEEEVKELIKVFESRKNNTTECQSLRDYYIGMIDALDMVIE
jgi:hypothetical protein